MNQVAQIIAREIDARGPIPFSRFMEMALYCPVCGYYEKESDRIGRRGDFFTSVSVGSLFGELLGLQISVWLEELLRGRGEGESGTGSVQIVEAGAHDGRLAADILGWMREWRPELFEGLRYWIVEPSERRRKWQERTLAGFPGHVVWTETFEGLQGPSVGAGRGVCGVIFANELLDAFPVHRFGWDASGRRWFEWGVGVDAGRFTWTRLLAGGATTKNTEDTEGREGVTLPSIGFGAEISGMGLPTLPEELLAVLPEGFTIETCPAAGNWWKAAARSLRRGKLITLDYGDAPGEWLRPERPNGTLRAYHLHQPRADLLANPGEQDLTAHVNFGQLIEVGTEAGLRTCGFQSQGEFLTRVAGRTWTGELRFPGWTVERTRQFQTLTHPQNLGQVFRVLIQERES